jgi:hypothetical protein
MTPSAPPGLARAWLLWLAGMSAPPGLGRPGYAGTSIGLIGLAEGDLSWHSGWSGAYPTPCLDVKV